MRRRYASPLEAVLLGVVALLAYALGKEAAAPLLRLQESAGTPLPELAAGAVLVLWALFGAGVARGLLHRARELALLVPGGLPPLALVRLRLVELSALNAVLGLLPLALSLGLRVGAGRGASPALLLAWVALAPALAGLGVVGAWLAGRLGRRASLALAACLACAAIALPVLAALPALRTKAALRPLFAAGGLPGGIVLAASEGAPPAVGAVCGAAFLSLLAAQALGPRRFGEDLDRAVQRRTRSGSVAWRLLGPALRPLGVAGALARRDLVLLFRGAFVRGILVLAALPLSLGIVWLLAREPGTRPWHLQLAGLLVAGAVASASGFLFGVDFPRARRGTLVLERSLPLDARSVLLSRWLLAAAYAALVTLAVGACLALAPKASLSRQALPFLPRGLLLGLVVTHHAVAYGLRSEARLDPAEAAAYPLNGAVVVVLFALGTWAHPLSALAYPVLWLGFVRSSLRRWERAEVETLHEAAA
ncbi:MAG: hypothetical protein D6731_14325 [Planctomycetota bacterium]|nr:MAG: hypothetical protein D6731_14325 [Planctomycetota bacterium]